MDKFKTAPLFVASLPETPAGTTYRFHYADMAEMAMAPKPPASAWYDCAWNGDAGFRGCSLADAIQMATLGWPEGADTARKLHEGVTAAMPERRRMASYGVAGAVPNVARALSGNPLNMRQLAMRETAQRPIISLVCSVGVNSGFPAEAMLSHAAAMAGVVDFLEGAGFRCEVLAAWLTCGSDVNAEIAVQLKAPEQPLNLAVMAYGLGHASFLRRHMFAILCTDPDLKPIGGGLGSSTSVKPAPELGTFTIASTNKMGRTTDAGYRFQRMLRELAEQDCPGIPQDAQAA